MAQADGKLESRILQLEKLVAELTQNKGQVKTMGAESIQFGGYLNVTATQNFNPKHGTEILADEVEYGFMSRGELNNSLSYFLHIEFEQEKKLTNKNTSLRTFDDNEAQIEAEDIFIEYSYANNHQLQIGSIITPFGYSNYYNHFDFLRWQNEKPLGIRPSGDNFLIFDEHVTGLNLKGKTEWRGHSFNYFAYSGTNHVNNHSMSSGLRLEWNLPYDYAKFGASSLWGKRADSFSVITSNNANFDSYGVDLSWALGRFEGRSEYYFSKIEGVADYARSFYVEPYVYLDDNKKYVIVSRVDYVDDPLGLSKSFGAYDPIKKYEYSFGFSYIPFTHWRNIITFTLHEYEGKERRDARGDDRDYVSIELGTVISF
jgi:hypothetical protein